MTAAGAERARPRPARLAWLAGLALLAAVATSKPACAHALPVERETPSPAGPVLWRWRERVELRVLGLPRVAVVMEGTFWAWLPPVPVDTSGLRA